MQAPTAMDCLGRHVLLASEPLQLTMLELQLQAGSGAAGGGKGPSVRGVLVPVRELNMFNPGAPLLQVRPRPQQRTSSAGSPYRRPCQVPACKAEPPPVRGSVHPPVL